MRGGQPGRRAPPHGAARSARSRELRIAHADVARGARRRAARDGRGATACATASSICRSPAASRGAIIAFPPAGTPPSVVVTARSSISARLEQMAGEGHRRRSPCRTTAGQRVDIKSVALLPNVLAKQAAREQGAREAWFVDAHGRVTEGASSNAWIVTRDGKVVTRPLGSRHSARHHPHGRARRDRGARARRSRSARSRSRRPMRRARPSSPRPARSSCRWCSIDGRPVGNGAPGLDRDGAAARLSSPRRDRLRFRLHRLQLAKCTVFQCLTRRQLALAPDRRAI